VKHLSN